MSSGRSRDDRPAFARLSRGFFMEPDLMRRIALLSLTMSVGGCGFNTWWNPPFTTGFNPNVPMTNSVNVGRSMGQGVAVSPLVTEPGDIWPGPLPPARTLQDLQRQAPATTQLPAPSRSGQINRSSDPLLAPLPAGSTARTPSGGRAAPPADRRIIVPNGNGTSTVIHPDGRIETIPTPK